LVDAVAAQAGAVVMAWYPGQQGGVALADLLSGDADFAGRLPMAWPASESQLPPYDPTALSVTYGPLHGWRWIEARGGSPAYAFGHGLSYAAATVVVDPLPTTWTLDAPLAVTGRIEGTETVQVYLRPDDPDALPAPRVLAGFERASGAFRVEVDPRWIARWDDAAGVLGVAPGRWTVQVATSSNDVVTSATVQLRAPDGR
jgi:beta-glucosidase